jgi:hypothetical protein
MQHLLDRNSGCLGFGEAHLNDLVFEGGMAEAILPVELHGATLASEVAFDPSHAPIRTRDERLVMSICIVRAAPDQVAALFETEPSSPSETGAFQSLAPMLSPCLRQGAEARLDRTSLRAMLALAAYRLVAPQVPQPSAR